MERPTRPQSTWNTSGWCRKTNSLKPPGKPNALPKPWKTKKPATIDMKARNTSGSVMTGLVSRAWLAISSSRGLPRKVRMKSRVV